jgi:hypothetical protein
MRLREVANGEEKRRFELHYFLQATVGPHGISISPDGHFAACGSYRGLVYLFQLPTPAPNDAQ